MKKQKIRITKEFRFEMAHALPCHNGPCRNIHGHSYTLSVTIWGYPIDNINRSDNGMIMDFSDLKKIVKAEIVDVFDHALVLNKSTNDKLKSELENQLYKIIWVDYDPTSENLIIDFVSRIQNILPTEIKLYSLKLRETATSLAEWYASDNQ